MALLGRKWAAATAALLALSLLGALPAPAHAGEGDNAAVAINTRDGSSVFRLAFKVRRVAGDVIDQTNAAVAYASCEECQTVAAAFQIVLVTGDPNVITPENYAFAINEGCSACETVAAAYQWVVGGYGPVRFTAEGNRRLAQVHRRLQELRGADLSAEELLAELEEIAAEIAAVLADELVPAGRPPQTDADVEATEGSDDATEPAQQEPDDLDTTDEPTDEPTDTGDGTGQEGDTSEDDGTAEEEATEDGE